MAMDINTAIRLAATTRADISTEDAHAIITEFLDRLIECTVCNGSGTFKVRSDTTYHYRSKRHDLWAGAEMACPQCGDSGADPAWGKWACERGLTRVQCTESDRCPEDSDCGATISFRRDLFDGALERKD